MSIIIEYAQITLFVLFSLFMIFGTLCYALKNCGNPYVILCSLTAAAIFGAGTALLFIILTIMRITLFLAS